jgi:ATP/maltotriose-dependent transcriptional regulator MalT
MDLKGSLGEAAVPLAEALYEQGRTQEAADLIEAVKEDWASGDASIEAPRLAVRAKLFAAQGWDEHADRAIRRALRLVGRTDWRCLQADTLLAQAEVLRLAGRDAEAAASAREATDLARGKQYVAAERRATAVLEALAGGTVRR